MIDKDYILSAQAGVSLRESVYETLKKAILTGEFKPQERLMEIPLSNMLGVSRTPVREAIKRLAQEELVTVQPRCGAKVAAVTDKNVTDAFWVWQEIAEMSVRLAARQPKKERIGKLRAINEEIAQALQDGGSDVGRICEADVRFYRTVCEASDNPVLLCVTEFLEKQILRYRMDYLRCEKDRERIVSEHEALIRALEAGDEEAAAKAVRQHIAGQEKQILAKLAPDV